MNTITISKKTNTHFPCYKFVLEAIRKDKEYSLLSTLNVRNVGNGKHPIVVKGTIASSPVVALIMTFQEAGLEQ